MKKNAQQALLEELGVLVSPLVMAAQSRAYRQELLAGIGWDIEAITGLPVDEFDTLLNTVGNSYQRLCDIIRTPPQTITEFLAALDVAADLFAVIRSLPTIAQNVGDASLADFQRLAKDLITFITICYLRELLPPVYHLGVLLTIIQAEEEIAEVDAVYGENGKLARLPQAPQELRLERIAELLNDPVTLLRNEYLPANGLVTAEDASYTANKLFPRLGNFLASLGVDVTYGLQPEYGLDFGSFGNEVAAGTLMVEVPLALGEDLPDVSFGALFSLSSAEQGDLGLVVAPFGEFAFTQATESWEFVFELTAGLPGFAIGPNGLTLPDNVLANTNVNARLAATKLPEIIDEDQAEEEPSAAEEDIVEETPEDEIVNEEDEGEAAPEAEEEVRKVAFLLGSTQGTRLEVGEFTFSAEASLQAGQQDYGLLLEVGRAALVISSGDGDAFLQEVLPPQELRAEFQFAVGWSKNNGCYFRGSAGLEGVIPLQLGIPGVLVVDSAHLAVVPGQDGDIRCLAAATLYVQLGPFGLLAEKLGLEAKFAFPAEGGNLGAAQLSLGFKLPDGVLAVVNGGAVSGVGYLSYDRANEQYAGLLMLEINGTIMLKSVGLLTTKMPDGTKGFSLLVIVSAEGFTPIQLGFGFTLNGVGGLLGVNRTMAVDALQTGIKTGALDAVFFPNDAIEGINRIINGINSVFPVQRGHHVFGPIFILGWGTPTIVTAKIAVLFELPGLSRLVVLGQLKSALPTEEKPLVYIQVDVVGVIDFDKRTLAIDASLRNSKLAAYTLTGDMALRAEWGDKPNLVMAAGGFNPRFQSPAGFPKLARLAISLASGDNPRLRLEAYFALTSNTVQFGARVDLYAEAFGFSIAGCLGFDALFQFSPFQFIADIVGMVALKHNGSLLMSVQLDMTLSGPAPWHVRGQASFKVLGFNASIDFDRRFGPAEQPPLPEPVNLLPLLLEALRDKRNWSGQLPKHGEHPRVSLREIPANECVLVHPLSELSVSQRVAPLNVEIARYGNTVPIGDRHFQITAVEIDGQSLATPPPVINDLFAPAQYLEMSDSEKLTSPSFEAMPSGVEIGLDTVNLGSAMASDIEYETIIIDKNNGTERQRGSNYKVPPERLNSVTGKRAVKQFALQLSKTRYRPDSLKITVEPPKFVIAHTSDLKVADIPEIVSGSQSATARALAKYLKAHPELRGKLQVVRKVKGVMA